MAGEMRDKESQIEVLRNTVELLNQNIRVLKEEAKWRDQQMKLLRVQDRQKKKVGPTSLIFFFLGGGEAQGRTD